jgi:hypothetical protein
VSSQDQLLAPGVDGHQPDAPVVAGVDQPAVRGPTHVERGGVGELCQLSTIGAVPHLEDAVPKVFNATRVPSGFTATASPAMPGVPASGRSYVTYVGVPHLVGPGRGERDRRGSGYDVEPPDG